MTRPLLRFADLTKGVTLKAGPVLVEAEAIKAFARQFDPQPFHLDEEAAKDSFFQGLAASGWHTAGLTMRMFVEAVQVEGGMVGAGIDELRWPRPTRAGDRLRITCEVVDARPMMSNPSRGLVRLKVTTFNQDDEVVQRMYSTIVMPTATEATAQGR